MTAQSVQVKLVLGHKAHLRDEPTIQGYTHDWTVYVCGPDGNKIQHFVEKVVFQLHESFKNPRRVVKEPPYEVKESGYAGFLMVIDVYFKNKDEPRKLQFKYDLFLNTENSPPVDHTRCETLTFQNPAEEFRRRLIKGGGVGVPCASDYTMHQAKTTPPPNKTSPITKTVVQCEPDKEFATIFGAPIKPEQHKKKTHSLSKEKHKSKSDSSVGLTDSISKEKYSSSKEKYSKRSLEESFEEYSDKKKKKREEKHKESSSDKSDKSNKEKSKSPKEKESQSAKHSKSPKDKDSVISAKKSSGYKSSKKSESSDKQQKSSKAESKSSKHSYKLDDEVHIEIKKLDTENKAKKELEPFSELLSDGELSGDNIPSSSFSSIFEQMKGPYGTDEDSLLSPLPERPDIFGSDSASENSPVKESSSKHKKKKAKKQKRDRSFPGSGKKERKSKGNKLDKEKNYKPENLPKVNEQNDKEEAKLMQEVESMSPDPEESPLHEDLDDPEQADSQTDAYEEEKEEPPSLEPRAPNGELLSELKQIHSCIQTSRDPEMLQKIVDIIEDTGIYVVSDKTFDFDLWKLNSSTLIEIKKCIQT